VPTSLHLTSNLPARLSRLHLTCGTLSVSLQVALFLANHRFRRFTVSPRQRPLFFPSRRSYPPENSQIARLDRTASHCGPSSQSGPSVLCPRLFGAGQLTPHYCCIYQILRQHCWLPTPTAVCPVTGFGMSAVIVALSLPAPSLDPSRWHHRFVKYSGPDPGPSFLSCTYYAVCYEPPRCLSQFVLTSSKRCGSQKYPRTAHTNIPHPTFLATV
jgi:hypothetical protein